MMRVLARTSINLNALRARLLSLHAIRGDVVVDALILGDDLHVVVEKDNGLGAMDEPTTQIDVRIVYDRDAIFADEMRHVRTLHWKDDRFVSVYAGDPK